MEELPPRAAPRLVPCRPAASREPVHSEDDLPQPHGETEDDEDPHRDEVDPVLDVPQPDPVEVDGQIPGQRQPEDATHQEDHRGPGHDAPPPRQPTRHDEPVTDEEAGQGEHGHGERDDHPL